MAGREIVAERGAATNLDDLAPERIKLASGRAAKITYGDDGAPPTIAARIQDLYDTPRGLAVGRGRTALRIQVLAPNHRPIQITNDLETFWREGYPKIKERAAAEISEARMAVTMPSRMWAELQRRRTPGLALQESS